MKRGKLRMARMKKEISWSRAIRELKDTRGSIVTERYLVIDASTLNVSAFKQECKQ